MSEENKDKEQRNEQIRFKFSDEFIKDIETIQKQYSELLRPSQIALNAIKTFENPARHLSQGLNSIALTSMRAVSANISNQFRAMDLAINPLVELKNHLQSTISPLIEYAEKNKENIENFRESSDNLISQLMEQHDISEDEAIYLFDELIEDGKIIVHEDWTVELIEDTVEDTAKSQVSLSEIMMFINIIIKTIAILVGTDIDIVIDNSTTHIENQIMGDVYYTDSTNEIQNEYIVINDIEMYESNDVDSDIIRTLDSGDKVRRIITDDDSELMLVAILNEDNELTDTGWIKIDDVTLID